MIGTGGSIWGPSRPTHLPTSAMQVCPVFVDETGVLSGSPREQPIYGIGALVVPDTRSITDSLYRLHFNFSRARMTERKRIYDDIRSRAEPPTLQEATQLMQAVRHHEYKFTKIRGANVQQYIDLLNLYFSFSEPQFHAVILDRQTPSYSLSRWNNDPWAAYAGITRDLLDSQLDRDVFAIVDFQGKPGASAVLFEDVICEPAHVKGCLRAKSDISVYLQIVDVLLGCVQFDLRDAKMQYSPQSRPVAAKRELVNFLKSRLGLSTDERLVPDDVSEQTWNTPSLFTVHRGRW